MADEGVDALLLSVGHDLPYLTGYLAMPLERLTMLVVPRDGEVTMVIPELQRRGLFRTEYESKTFRGNLGVPIPQNRFTKNRVSVQVSAAASSTLLTPSISSHVRTQIPQRIHLLGLKVKNGLESSMGSGSVSSLNRSSRSSSMPI